MMEYTDSAGWTHKIHIEQTGNPTPCRNWDYLAATDDYDGAPDAGPQLTGQGSTEEEAYDDLVGNIEESL
jgi:hypothetical protein